MLKEIVWVLGPEEAKSSGVSMYSQPIIPKVRALGVSVTELYFQGRARSIRRYWGQFIATPIRLLKYRNRDDLVVLLYEEALAFSVPWLRLWSIPTAIVVHHRPTLHAGDGLIAKAKYAYLRLIERAIKSANVVLVPTNETKKSLRGLAQEDLIEVIPNSFDLLPRLDRELAIEILRTFGINLKGDRPILLYVGTDEKRKNLSVLLDALKILARDIFFMRVGTSHSDQRRLEESDELTAAGVDHVFLQKITFEQLRAVYSVSDILISPSVLEGFGRPVIEAQSFGAAICASKIPVYDEVLRSSYLPVSEIASSAAWSNALRNLVDSRASREALVEAGKENCKRFQADSIASDLIEVLSRACNSTRRK